MSNSIAMFAMALVRTADMIKDCRRNVTFAALDAPIEGGYYETDESCRLYVNLPDGRSCGEYNYRTWKLAESSVGELYLYEQGVIERDTVGGLEVRDIAEFGPAVILPSIDYRRRLQHPRSVRLPEMKESIPLELIVRGIDGLNDLQKKYRQLLA